MEPVSSAEQHFLKKLTDIIDANLHNEQFGVKELADELGMSRATLHRKVKTIVKKSVSEFIRENRLKHANELLLQKAGTISEIAYMVGFGSVTYFSKCFHDYYGYPPGEAENREFSKNPDEQNHENEIRPTWNRKKILIGGIILTALITVLAIIFLVKPFQPRTLPKTVAVLPFINDSKDDSTTVILNGVLEEIIKNLQVIKDMSRVCSRTSVEQYRDNKTKNIKQIARELDVAYIVEASGQKQGNQIKIHVQLIDAELDNHLFAEDYEKDIEDIFDLESEIAILVAKEIGAIITPEEKERIDAKPTKSIKAYNLYTNASDLLTIGGEYSNPIIIKQAEPLIRQAIHFDSTYSDAYVLLAKVLWGLGKNMDTVMHLLNRALIFNDKNADAFLVKGNIYLWNLSNYDDAENAFKSAIKYNPGSPGGYDGLGDLMWMKGEFAKNIDYKLKALKRLKRTSKGYDLTYYLSYQLYALGFFDEGLKLAEEIISDYGDSTMYFLGLEAENMNSENYMAAYEYSLKRGGKDNIADWWCTANILLRLKAFKGSLSIVDSLDKYGGPNIKFFKKDGQIIPWHYVGYTYFKNGLKEKAKFHFDGVIESGKEIIKQNKGRNCGYLFLQLIMTYSAMDDKVKAVETMKMFLDHKEEIQIKPVDMLEFRNHPMCDIIKDTPEHREILKIAEENFQPVKKEIEGYLRDAGY